jgi:hypothetical protein
MEQGRKGTAEARKVYKKSVVAAQTVTKKLRQKEKKSHHLKREKRNLYFA